MPYKSFIVDDELINISIVQKLLQLHFPEIEVVGTACTIEVAVNEANKFEPDLLFLDVNISSKEIFEIISEFDFEAEVIFISSEQKYAFQAFKVEATDFLTKPINSDDFMIAVNRAIKNMDTKEMINSIRYARMTANDLKANFLAISSIDKHEIIKVKDIMFCIADGKCTIFFLNNGKKIYSYKNLNEFDYLTESNPYFLRISRSSIINFEYVSRVIKKVGTYCEFENGISLPVSRRKMEELNKFLKLIE